MKTRMFDGKVYIKASELARDYRYTSDYIGQLARSQKIEAKLAGKTWYVHEASLTAYIKRGYVAKPVKATRAAPKTEEKKPNVSPVPANKATPKPKIKPKSVRRSRSKSKLDDAVSAILPPSPPPTPVVAASPARGIWQKASSWFSKKIRKD